MPVGHHCTQARTRHRAAAALIATAHAATIALFGLRRLVALLSLLPTRDLRTKPGVREWCGAFGNGELGVFVARYAAASP